MGKRKVIKDSTEEQLESLVLGQNDNIPILNDEAEEPINKDESSSSNKQAAWVDEDDLDERVNLSAEKRFKVVRMNEDETVISSSKLQNRLLNQFEKIVGTSTPNWAKPCVKNEEVISGTSDYIVEKPSLSPKTLEFLRCRDGNIQQKSNYLSTTEFHPFSQILLTTGHDSYFHLFHIDGEFNEKLHSVLIEGYPIHGAHFTVDGEQIVLGSKSSFMYYFDIMSEKVIPVGGFNGVAKGIVMDKFSVSKDGQYLAYEGRNGEIHFLSAKTKEYLSTIKMNGYIESVTFSNDSQYLYSHGDSGKVFIWDMRNQKQCCHSFVDDGCVKGTLVALSPNNTYLATGSDSGILNLYDRKDCSRLANPIPKKIFKNLRTPIFSGKFNSDEEIFAYSSCSDKNAVRLVHLNSLTVFSNFPDREDNMDTAYTLDISPGSGYLTVGNTKKQALLYRLKHFDHY